jgi:tRNA threonylcarbamoyladenosine biosynthesis protein TsaE
LIESHPIFHSPAETIAFGYAWGQTLTPDTVICFFGDLAAGKTTLIKGIAAGASGCPQEIVSSPTFVYLNIYSGSLEVYHFDLYRLQGKEAFISMGFDEYFDAGGIVCIEWSERIEDLLPEKRFDVFLTHAGENMRSVKIVERGR